MKLRGLTALLPVLAAVGSMASAMPAAAADCWNAQSVQAAKLRQLDVMLMVSSLRCRKGADDFQADYDRFLNANRPALSAANHVILDQLALQVGRGRAMDKLDRMSVSIANRYGQGGSAGCRELKRVAQQLGRNSGPRMLADTADALVGDDVLDKACSARVTLRR